MFFLLPYLNQDGWCGCVLSTSTTTAFFAVWSPPARLQAGSSYCHFTPPVLCSVHQVLELNALSCLHCPAWQLEVYLVSGAGKQVHLRECSSLLRSLPPRVLFADLCKSCPSFASKARLSNTSLPPLPLEGWRSYLCQVAQWHCLVLLLG